MMPPVPTTSWSQKGWCNKPTKLEFNLIFRCSQNIMDQAKSTVELTLSAIFVFLAWNNEMN